MAALSSLVGRFLDKERGVANILAPDSVTAQAVAAVSLYAGYSKLSAGEAEIDESLDITVSEWAEIRPLFLLYVERETALHMEATAMLGVSGLGRSSSEVAGDINQYEADFARRVFFFEAFTV